MTPEEKAAVWARIVKTTADACTDVIEIPLSTEREFHDLLRWAKWSGVVALWFEPRDGGVLYATLPGSIGWVTCDVRVVS